MDQDIMGYAVSNYVELLDSDFEWQAIRSQGSGGQNVNKVSTAVHLRFDINKSSLPEVYKEKLLELSDSRITKDGVLVLKSQETRSQEKNKEIAITRLIEWIQSAMVVKKKRKPTKSTYSSKQKRMDKKSERGDTKKTRGRVDY